jgi:asparagine synthase (glutamine-hydrolysing)
MLSGFIGGGSVHRQSFDIARGIRLAQQISWDIIAQSREWLYTNDMWRRLGPFSAYSELSFPWERMRRWHPLNQSLYAGYKVMLPGLLLSAKGDRPLRAASTEGRYPFLDEDVVDFCASIAPEYKLRGWTDKWLLRRVADRIAPAQFHRRSKTMFRANLGQTFLGAQRPHWVDQLLSRESLAKTGWFDFAAVQQARDVQFRKSHWSLRRFALDFGLAAVVSTQLWHHLYCGGGLADLPTWTPPKPKYVDAAIINDGEASRPSRPTEGRQPCY